MYRSAARNPRKTAAIRIIIGFSPATRLHCHVMCIKLDVIYPVCRTDSLPLLEWAAAGGACIEAATVSGAVAIGTQSVTIVDDEPAALDVLVRAAEQWHYQCQAAHSAEEAIALLERNPTPIVVTDIRMPGRGGLWLVSEIHKRWPDIGIIVTTAGHDTEIVEKCLEAGAHHFFFKPVDFGEFHHALEITRRSFQLKQTDRQYRSFLEETVRRKTRKIRKTYISAIESLVLLLEARDPYTSGHSMRVCSYSTVLARRLGLDHRERRQVRLAAKLHDIGKIGIPEAILNKPDQLSAHEREWIQRHPTIGERVLRPIIRSRAVLAAVRHHHERYDGLGYPDGLAGDRIPKVARLIAVADCFDALTSSRAYRKARTIGEALDILTSGAATQFDPQFVLPFVELVRSGQLDEHLR